MQFRGYRKHILYVKKKCKNVGLSFHVLNTHFCFYSWLFDRYPNKDQEVNGSMIESKNNPEGQDLGIR